MQAPTSLRKWFLKSRRDLPWRDSPTPYAVWVSEVMLQQTQVAVVIPYFLHWMERFPTIQALADAPLDSVIKAWEGLGYYSRARNLHAGARYVVQHFGGELPDDPDSLSQIKGLGPYTVGAILSFAFHRRAAAVDGNVIRVLTRFYGIEEDIAKPKTQQLVRERALDFLPQEEPWVISEALIELGATVCQKQPRCNECPLKKECNAYKQKTVDRLPYKSTKIKYEKLYRTVAIVVAEDENRFFSHNRYKILLRRGGEGEIMNDLHEFPFFEEQVEIRAIGERLKEAFGLHAVACEELKQVSHSFTRYRVKLKPFICEAVSTVDVPGYFWAPIQSLEELAFSSGHKRILSEFNSLNFKYL